MAVLAYGPDPTDVIGRRIFAWLLDGIIPSVLVFLVGAATGAFNIPPALAQRDDLLGPYIERIWLITVLVYVGYLLVKVVCTAYYGWTPGKLMLGLRVVCWDGRPPGLVKALIRGAVFGIGEALLSCIYDLAALAVAMGTRGHRQPADLAANTYVIDASYEGRLIMTSGSKTHAGPDSVSAEDIADFHAQRGAGLATPGHKPTEPFYDKERDTYVVFNEKRNAWLAFDKKGGTWDEITDAGGPSIEA